MSNTNKIAPTIHSAAATEQPKVGSSFRDGLGNDEAPLMIVVPAGEFLMGAAASEAGSFEDERPQHTVQIAKPFAISVYPITFAEFDVFAQDTRRELPDDENWGRKKRPVINITFNDAVEYCDWLSRKTGRTYRLPSEAEWEYCARAGTETAYWWGDDIGNNHTVCENGGSRWDDDTTAPVGAFKHNPFGLGDVHGNVWEWTQDRWHSNYDDAPTDGSAQTTDNPEIPRVIRGGSWLNNPVSVRSAVRSDFHPNLRVNIIGFRICSTL